MPTKDIAGRPIDSADGAVGSSAAIARGPELLQVEADIARTRAQVSLSVMALRKAVARRTDWREWVRERPGLFLAAAFAVGVIWGSRSGRRRSA